MKKIKLYKKLNKFDTSKLFTKEFMMSKFKIILGTLISAAAYQFLVIPTNLIAGGVSGVGQIIHNFYPTIQISYIVYALSIALLIPAYIFLGKEYFLQSVFLSILFPAFLQMFELIGHSHVIMNLLVVDGSVFTPGHYNALGIISKILQLTVSSIVGCIFIGIGLGMVFDENASTGGIDIVQRLLNKYLHMPFTIAIMFTDGVIVLFSIFTPLQQFDNVSAVKVLTIIFSFISVFSIGIPLDKYIQMRRRYYTLFITAPQPEIIKSTIVHVFHRTFTIIPAKGGYSKNNTEVIMVTLNAKQMTQLTKMIRRLDNLPFTVSIESKKVIGHGFVDKLGE